MLNEDPWKSEDDTRSWVYEDYQCYSLLLKFTLTIISQCDQWICIPLWKRSTFKHILVTLYINPLGSESVLGLLFQLLTNILMAKFWLHCIQHKLRYNNMWAAWMDMIVFLIKQHLCVLSEKLKCLGHWYKANTCYMLTIIIIKKSTYYGNNMQLSEL